MAKLEEHRIVETAAKARQAERGPTMLAVLAMSVGLAVLILGSLWMVFFRG
jgi:hypothetical protein